MTEELYDYLLKEWRFNNHPKYLKYFELWISNISENQIFHFNRMMISGDIYKK